MTVMYFAERLVSDYGTDPAVQALLGAAEAAGLLDERGQRAFWDIAGRIVARNQVRFVQADVDRWRA